MDRFLLRNIGIIAHIDAGKTTFSERVLFYSNVIHRMGEVHEGAATMDFLPEEQDRGITIASACITCLWQGHTINLVDTPGHVDFTIEVERCLRVLDAAVGIFCAVGGVEPQSETVWRQADTYGIPRLAVVNKMDRPGASFAGVLEAIKKRLGAKPVALTIPLGEGECFCAVLDLVRQQKILFDSLTFGRRMQRLPFTAKEKALAEPWRDALIDAVTLEDDSLLDEYLSGMDPDPQSVDAALRKGTLGRRLVPVFAASALRNIGVQAVLDAVCRYLPSPLETPPAVACRKKTAGRTNKNRYPPLQKVGKKTLSQTKTPQTPAGDNRGFPCKEEEKIFITPDPKSPVCALAFKIMVSEGRKTVFLRLYSGTVREGDTLINVSSGKQERIMRLYRLHAGEKERLSEAGVGDIVAAQGLKEAHTGDTLISAGPPVLLEPLHTRQPVIALAFEPKNSVEGERLDTALAAFATEDPTLSVNMNEHTGQRIVSGMGELHLSVLVDRMQREWNLAPRVGNPQVVCQETVRAEAEGKGEFDRELAGQPHYGLVELCVVPRERGGGVRVTFDENACHLAEWQASLIQAVEQGVRDACYSGPAGFIVQDIAITISKLGRKQGLATVPGLHMAAQRALRHALEKAGPLVLEPIMEVGISVPDTFLGATISLLAATGAKVEEIDEQAGQKQIKALAPMRGLFGFATSLRSVTQGRAGMLMRFLHFDAV